MGYTGMFLPRTGSDYVLQDDTLVLAAHRGRRLGTLLKVTHQRQLESVPFDVIARRTVLQTYTAKNNVPMPKVNARFGFCPIEAMYEYERTS